MVKTILITGATWTVLVNIWQRNWPVKVIRSFFMVVQSSKSNWLLKRFGLLPWEAEFPSYFWLIFQNWQLYRFAEENQAQTFKGSWCLFNAGLYAGKERKASAEMPSCLFMLSALPLYVNNWAKSLVRKAVYLPNINVSSYMHHFAKVRDLDLRTTNHPGLAYNNSKLYTIWMTRHLSKRFLLKRFKYHY